MATIYTVPDIFLINGELLTSDGNGEFMKLHDRQGSLDGACSVYSLVMSLLYENIIRYEETEKPSRSNGGRLLKELFSDHGLIKDGFYFKVLKRIIDKYTTKSWRVEYENGLTTKECVEGICNEIKNGCAPIISVGYCGEDDGHALLAVGFEEAEGKIERIFCLDPGAPTPKTSIWNSYIDVHDLRKRSAYVNTDTVELIPALVQVQDYIVIENLKEVPISHRS